MTNFLLFLLILIALAVLIIVAFSLFYLNQIKKETYMNQKRIDDLTAQLQANNENVVQVIKDEVAEVKKAIEDQTLDTSALEAAIAQNSNLADLVKGIYNAPAEPTEELPTEPTEEIPTEETPAEPTEPTEELPVEPAEPTEPVEPVEPTEETDKPTA